jgi:hypothetical protein
LLPKLTRWELDSAQTPHTPDRGAQVRGIATESRIERRPSKPQVDHVVCLENLPIRETLCGIRAESLPP